MHKTKDGFDITVGMTIWVNPDCAFRHIIKPHAFTDKHIVTIVAEDISLAYPIGMPYRVRDFFNKEIFAKKENWLADRENKIEEVISGKRNTLMGVTERMEREINTIEKIRDGGKKL